MAEKFLLGAATAAHQVEGYNKNSDCWAQEQMIYGGYKEKSGIACDHYNRYEEDIKLMKEAGLNAYRFSIEWARIEPQEGVFDEKEIEHYRNVIACCKENGIEPVVTLLHFSSPVWLIQKGGWEADSVVGDFDKYVTYVMEKLGGELHYVCTINEANMGLQVANISKQFIKKMMSMDSGSENIQMGIDLETMMKNQQAAGEENKAVFGTDQPHIFNLGGSEHSDMLVMKAHQAAKERIKSMYPDMKVGLTLSLHDIQPVPGGEVRAQEMWDEEFAHYLPYIKDDDFLGVQNYTRARVDAEDELPVEEGAELTQMGYEYYPEGLENVIRAVAKEFHNDLFITENGLATDNDEQRVNFIHVAAQGVHNCIKDGIPVKGYFYWSLLDNFEWQLGYGMTFGLISVNRENMERTPKGSLYELGRMFQPE